MKDRITTNINNFLKNIEELNINDINNYIYSLEENNIDDPVIFMLPAIKEYIKFDTKNISDYFNTLDNDILLDITERNIIYIDYTSYEQKKLIDNYINNIDQFGLYKDLENKKFEVTNEYISLLINNEITAITYYECLIKKLLANNKLNTSIKYTSFIDIDKVFNYNYTISEIINNINKFFDVNNSKESNEYNNTGYYDEYNNTINLNISNFTLNTYKDMHKQEQYLKQTIYHEFRHIIQKNIRKTNTIEAYIFKKNLIISDRFRNFYKENHDYFEMEIDAEYYAALKTNNKKDIDEINFIRCTKEYDYINNDFLNDYDLFINDPIFMIEYNQFGKQKELDEILNNDDSLSKYISYNKLINEKELDIKNINNLKKLEDVINYGLEYEKTRLKILQKHHNKKSLINQKYILNRIKKLNNFKSKINGKRKIKKKFN